MTDLLKYRKRILHVSMMGILVFLSSCGKEMIKNQSVGEALGTSYSIIYLTNDETDFQADIDSVFMAINRSLSTYIPTSDISKINRGDSTLVTDTLFRDVFTVSKEVYGKTNGYFDPTVGTLVNAWGFGPGKQIEMDSTKVDSLLNFVGFDKVSMAEDGTVKKESPDIYLDFNAIAKGYTVDCLARMLDRKGIGNYLIEVGGELISKGQNVIKGKPWIVGIDDPQIEEGRELKILINLEDKALASSGNYRKFRIDPETGEKYVHTVDPKTGFTKSGNTLGVTVLASTCAEADGYATAFMAMDLDNTLKLLSQHAELEGYIVYIDSEGISREFMTDGFRKFVVNPNVSGPKE